MKSGPYSLLVDGSNDIALKKLNPLTVKLYDASCRQVATRLLDCGTATTIFNKIDLVLSTHSIPWSNCVGFGVDNTSVNVGLRHSIMTQVKSKNNECYFMGCPCHLVHNIGSKGAEAFHAISGFDVEDVCVDLF